MGQFGVGQPVRRLEDQRLLTGQGRYTDDIQLADQAYGYVLRSPIAHATITRLEVEAARAAPGVLGVYTAAELAAGGVGTIKCIAPQKGKDGSGTINPPWEVLASERVRHVGNPVAFVVAETLAQARDASELIEVDYDSLPAVTDTAVAVTAEAPQIHPAAPGNLALHYALGDEAGVANAFAQAAKVARIDLVNNRVVVNSMETRGVLAEYDTASGRFTMTSGNQGIFRLKGQVAAILGVTEDKLHLVCPEVGGGFGMKIFLYPEYVCALFAARHTGRPVRWISDRQEAFLSDTQGRDHVTHAEMALDAEGRFLGLRVDCVAAMGAYLSNFAPYIPTGSMTAMFSGLYRIPAIYSEVRCVFTNTVPVDAYRGAGRPEAAYAVERLVDECGRVMGLSQLEIRQRNFVRPQDLPYDTRLGRIYDSGNFGRVLTEAAQRGDWAGVAARREAAQKRGRLLGVGVGCYIEACSGIGEETAIVRVDSDGGVTLIIGTQTNGQGHLTAYAQMLNEKLGVDIEKVRMIQGDSDIVAKGGGTGGSRSLLMGGVAINRASDRIVERVKQLAAHLFETAVADVEFTLGVASVVGTDRRMTLGELAQAAAAGGLPAELGGELKESGEYKAEALTYPNGAHLCELEVDPETGQVALTRYTVVDDFGTVMNPLMAAGQVFGGAAQGVGQALLEQTLYNEDGQLVTGSFMDYCMPRADDMPHIEITFLQDMPCKTNPLGVKGSGEAGAIGAPPAIMNALLDALRPLGVTRLDMPATPERVWRAIQEASVKQAAE